MAEKYRERGMYLISWGSWPILAPMRVLPAASGNDFVPAPDPTNRMQRRHRQRFQESVIDSLDN